MRITSDGDDVERTAQTVPIKDSSESMKVKVRAAADIYEERIRATRESYTERQVTIQSIQEAGKRNAESARDKQRENINNMKKLSPVQMQMVEYGMDVSDVLEMDKKKLDDVFNQTKQQCEKYERQRVMNDWLWFMIFGDCEDQMLMLSRYSNLMEMVEFCIDDYCSNTNAMGEPFWNQDVIKTLRRLALPEHISVHQWTEKLAIARSVRAHSIMMEKSENQKKDKINTVIRLRDSLNSKKFGAGNKYEENYRKTPDLGSNESISEYVCVTGDDVRGVLTLLSTTQKIPIPSLHKKDVEDILLAYMLTFNSKLMDYRMTSKDPSHRFAYPAETWEYFCGYKYGYSLAHALSCLVDSRPLYDRGRPLRCKGMVILIRSYPMYAGVYNPELTHREVTDDEIRAAKRRRGEKAIVYT